MDFVVEDPSAQNAAPVDEDTWAITKTEVEDAFKSVDDVIGGLELPGIDKGHEYQGRDPRSSLTPKQAENLANRRKALAELLLASAKANSGRRWVDEVNRAAIALSADEFDECNLAFSEFADLDKEETKDEKILRFARCFLGWVEGGLGWDAIASMD